MPQYKFFLNDEGEVGVKPQLTGDEPDPLALSIQKWQFIVECLEEGKQVSQDGGIHTCALCRAYHSYGCTGCPIFKFTRCSSCNRTPIQMWEMEVCTLAVAKAELYFLVALQEYLDHIGFTKGE